MTKLHSKSSARKDKPYDLGTVEEWKLEKISTMNLSLHTIAGGKERITEAKVDRLLIVLAGFASNLETRETIRDGAVVEIPAGTTAHFQGQMKYYLVAAN